LYFLEKDGGFTDKGTPAAFDSTPRRLAAGSQMLLNFWYTAWIESAVAAPGHAASTPSTK